MSYLRIPKVRVTISKLVDHILYDPFGIPNNRFLLERVVISDSPSVIQLKGLRDSYSSLDDIVLRLISNRRFADSVTLTDASIIEFVTAVLRNISDVVSMTERPFLLQIPGIKQDLISIIDSIILDRILDRKPEDTVTLADSLSRTFSAFRVFADNVGMIDNFTLIDGSTYTLDKGIRDFLTVGLDTPIRVSNSAAENISFLSTKLLIDSTTTIERIAKLASNQLTDPPMVVTDDNQLRPTKQLADELANADTTTTRLNKAVADNFETGFEKLLFTVLKSLADTASMIDNLDLGDQLLYDAIKDLDDAFEQSDQITIYQGKTADTDFITPPDDEILWFNKAPNSSVSMDSAENYYLNKLLVDAVDTPELFQIFKSINFADTVTLADLALRAFTRGLLLSDTVGVNNTKTLGVDRFYFIKRPTDTADISEQLTRTVGFQRSPAQGFSHNITEPDALRSDLGIGVGSGSYRNVPLLRTNLIYFSEQFGAPYWEKFKTSVDSDSYAFPDLVYADPSTTVFDPTYEAANLMEIFEGYQYRNPAGRASWFREAKLTSQTQAVSAADLIVEDTTVGQHYIEATVEADLPDLEKFAFAVYLKPNNRRFVRIEVSDQYYAVFDINSGLVVGTNAESAQIGRASTDGWFLCSLTARLTAYELDSPIEEMFVLDVLLNAPDNPRGIRRWALLPSERQKNVRISALQDSSLTQTYLGSGEGAFWAWGAQLETGDQVEQEKNSLTYIKTVGGQASKYGFNIMPRDTDRVFTGSLHRQRSIWPTRLHNDENERIDFLIGQEKLDVLQASDEFIKNRILFLTAKLDQQIDFSSTTVAAGTGSDFVFMGRQIGDNGTTDNLENVNRYMIKTGKRGYNADPTVAERWTRTNYITNSEDFRRPSWTKVRTISFRSLLLTSGNLPYRSTYDDASQIMELFDVPRPNTYYINRWYEMTPLSDLPDYTSNVVCDVYEQPLFGEHLVQTTIYDNNLDKDVFSYSVYASPVGGVYKFRMQVNNNQFADFDLSSVSVVSSSTNIFYSNIQTIDSSNQVYLCRIIGPAVRITQTFSSQDFTDAAVVFTTSTNIIRLVEFNRVFEETPLQAQDNFISGLVQDFELLDGNEDYQILSGADEYN